MQGEKRTLYCSDLWTPEDKLDTDYSTLRNTVAEVPQRQEFEVASIHMSIGRGHIAMAY